MITFFKITQILEILFIISLQFLNLHVFNIRIATIKTERCNEGNE